MLSLKTPGLLFPTAAVLKGHELLTVPAPGKDLWSWRPWVVEIVHDIHGILSQRLDGTDEQSSDQSPMTGLQRVMRP